MSQRSGTSVVVITVDDSSPRDAQARCERCGCQGTAARATHQTSPPVVYRYCASCWPAARAELEARQRADHERWQDVRWRDPRQAPAPPAGWSMASRVWDDVRSFLALIAGPPHGGGGPTAADLAAIAEEIQTRAAEYDDPMPPDIAAFVGEHRPPAP